MGAAPDDLLVDVQGVSKRFCRGLRRSLRYAAADMVRELVTGRRPGPDLRPEEFWAVRDVSVGLRRGEALGLVGRNGAGKTTLLRMIAGLIRPDAGVVRTRGRVVPLLALGAGFNPVLSGRENIVVNMSILGVPATEIRRRMDEVIAFAEIDPAALAAPVRTYSSGMAARLGFAAAIHTDPDVLLIDEVLAVGDMAFRAKCYRKLAELRGRGTAFIMVSHSTQMITSVCDHAAYLVRGRLQRFGPAADVMDGYELDLGERSSEGPVGGIYSDRNGELQPKADSALHITDVRFETAGGERAAGPESGETGRLCVRFRSGREIPGVGLFVIIRDANGTGDTVLVLNSLDDGRPVDVGEGDREIRLTLDPCGLRPGAYTAKIAVLRFPMDVLDVVESFPFRVRPSAPVRECRFYQPREWDSVPVAGPVPSEIVSQ
jgi:lipopolysaccharide transport system ATP-binding protein